MARIRTLKPEFWGDEKLAPLPPIHRLVFLGLVSMADDQGRLVDNLKAIDGALFSETDDTARESLEVLSRMSRITRYVAPSGQRVIQVTNWAKHQKVNHPKRELLPPPPPEVVVDNNDTETPRKPRAARKRTAREPQENRTPLPTTNDLRSTTDRAWTTEAGEKWRHRGEPPFARIGRALKPLVEKHGARQVLAAWFGYLSEKRDKSFATPEDFAANYNQYLKWAEVIGADGCTWEPIPDEPEAAA